MLGTEEPDESLPGQALPLCRFNQESVQSMFDALQESVIVVDDQLRIISLNAAAVGFFGRELSALAGQTVCDLFPEHDCPSACLEETLRTGTPIRDYQTAVTLPGGRPGQVLIRTVPLWRSAGGPPAGAAVILRDVTDETTLRKEASGRYRLGGIVGKNRRMQELFRLIESVAPSEVTVLVRGETGTGKELVARALHFASQRAEGPFVPVNCSALSEGLLESELFGHVKGAFTGAVAARQGRFEEARGGTIFLDEVGDVTPAVQVKLLRVLQEHVIERVGDNRPIQVDVRVVSATHRDLEALLASGRLRQDFYYRIKVVTLEIPPLRERREDIPLLVARLLERLRGRQAAETVLAPEAMRLLLGYGWPGNVRELENALEHALALSRGGAILAEHLPPEVRGGATRADALRQAPPHSPAERELLAAALARAGWNRTRAARQLGIDRSTLWRKIREYGLEPAD